MSILIAMYSGVRNNTLCKLKLNSITDDGFRKISHMNSNKNSKNKDLSIPLPPGVLRRLHNYIDLLELEPEDPLLYGLRGYSLKNKQFNAVTKNLCIELDWMTVRDLKSDEEINKENETVDGNKVYTRTSKYFTPHAFRYTIPTILKEMKVPDDTLEFLLGHSQFKKG